MPVGFPCVFRFWAEVGEPGQRQAQSAKLRDGVHLGVPAFDVAQANVRAGIGVLRQRRTPAAPLVQAQMDSVSQYG